jgi:hypothetical protein
MSADRSIARILTAALYGADRAGAEAIPSYLDSGGARATAHRAAFALLDWALPESPDRRSPAAALRLSAASQRLLALQREGGTIDSDNLRSPPDTAFVAEVLEDLLRIAAKEAGIEAVRDSLDRITLFCDRAADALAISGVHTPNHRWVVCGVLAQAYRRTGRDAYRERCLDWLGEGIDIDADGQFSERSSGIYSSVTSQALIRMADGLGLPALLEPVRRSLESTLLLAQPGGEVETVASRRQDQAQTASLGRQLFSFAYMACLDGNPRFAWASRLGLERPDEAMEALHAFLAFEPPGGCEGWALPPASEAVDEYTAFFAGSGLVRRRSGELAISIYGGSDLAFDPSLPDASGIASNPAFLTFRHGLAACRWLRFRPRYFDLPSARFLLEGFDGSVARLSWRRTVPYYLPLPPEKRRPDGDYALSTGDGRFWSKLAFQDRPRSNECSLEARLAVALAPTGCRVEVEIEANVRTPASIELAFDAECEVAGLPGCLEVSRGGSSFRVLSEGLGAWRKVADGDRDEPGRHAILRDGEGAPKELRRWALEIEAPGRFALTFDASRRSLP